MVRKKSDYKIRVMIENGVALGHRTMFFVVGEKDADQVATLHKMFKKAVGKGPKVLWCYKQKLGLPRNRAKRKSGNIDISEEDAFEQFVAATTIGYCSYAETDTILGKTFGMCVLQDFEAITPNLLARTIETVEGGGIIVVLLGPLNSLRQVCTMSMDVHSRYSTESHQDVVGRFNERFILSVASCKRCVVMDDQLSVLPLSAHVQNVAPLPQKPQDESWSKEELQLEEMKESLKDTPPVGCLANCCRTLDQATALLKFIEAISDKSVRSTVALTAGRGRGKSAALGLAIAGAVAFGYSNIFVTSPSPENLETLFHFILRGFDALEYAECTDYEVVQSTNPEFKHSIIRVNVFREHRQTIQYIHPKDSHKLGLADLVVVDEAAAIPLPLVTNLLGPYPVFMASTINGYEGTGRSLSLKLIQQLRQQSSTMGKVNAKSAAAPSSNAADKASASGRVLHEVQLNESIRYKLGDNVEAWLNSMLCLNAESVPLFGCPFPGDCNLYYVNRDTLFSFHRTSEEFLQRLIALYVSSHYKNTPNDLQMLADAPAHHLFCLLGPVVQQGQLPHILCVIQVCLEGRISKESFVRSLSRGMKSSGDLIPWTISQQFQDDEFPGLSGARIVRIATHPDCQKMGYGKRAMECLQQYYEGKIIYTGDSEDNESIKIDEVLDESVGLLEEKIRPRKSLPPLLLKLNERPPEKLHYLGVSYGITDELFKFWKANGYTPVYLRQTVNDLTGEHSCIMLKAVNAEEDLVDNSWLDGFWNDFRRRFMALLGFQFRSFSPLLALSILTNRQQKETQSGLSKEELEVRLTKYDLKRLDLYSNNLVDYHIIVDLLPEIAKMYFCNRLPEVELESLQGCILLGLGLQCKTVEDLEKDLKLPRSQLLAFFNRLMKRLSEHLNGILLKDIASTMVDFPSLEMEPTRMTLEEDLDGGANLIRRKEIKEKALLMDEDLRQYAIKGSEDDWNKAISASSKKNIITFTSEKRKLIVKKDEKKRKKKTKIHSKKRAKK